MRDRLNGDGTSYECDSLQRVMVDLIGRWIPRLIRMNGVLAYNETGLPLLTSDNPAVMWKKNGDNGFIIGVNQYERDLVVSCPLSPSLMFLAYQTQSSHKAVYDEQHDTPHTERKAEQFSINIAIGTMPEWEVLRMNSLCLGNAHRYVYANYCNDTLLQFLRDGFFGAPAPVRQWDLRPIDSPVA